VRCWKHWLEDIARRTLRSASTSTEALNRLANESPFAAKRLEHRQFARLGHAEIAVFLGIAG
jgi:DNA polymerase I-like protein with 3'-5' exonuclease and polymerase domains